MQRSIKSTRLNFSLPSIKRGNECKPKDGNGCIDDDRTTVKNLDQWHCQKTKKPRCQTRSSSIFMLYRNNIHKQELHSTQKKGEVMLYLYRLDSQLKKITEINYLSIHKNIEYCCGIYENSYNSILKIIARFHEDLTTHCDSLANVLREKANNHINAMESAVQAEKIKYKHIIPMVSQSIEEKEKQLQEIQQIIEAVRSARLKVLRHALSLGYDVREDGLVWIIKELGQMPHPNQMPDFLNQREIKYIKRMYESYLQRKKVVGLSSLGRTYNKTEDQIVEIVTRRKQREMSMVKENEEVRRIIMSNEQLYNKDKHKYLNNDVLELGKKQLNCSKETRYEIIYKETLKKLNKMCINEIYHKVPRRDLAERRASKNTLGLLEYFDSKLDKTQQRDLLKSQEERELELILRDIRYESYHNQSETDKHSRNPISVICCLVGWNKARKIIEQEMNYLF